jgi:putative copper export protein
MISPTLESVRLFIHVLAASVWVGGQIVLAGLVPKVRRSHPDALNTIAQAFARVAWPAMAIVVVTGIWNVLAVDPSSRSTTYMATLMLKLLFVGVTIAATVIHSMGTSKAAKAVGGAVGLLTALAAMYLGLLIAHAS